MYRAAVSLFYCVFFFNNTATTEISTLPLPDALPICSATPAATSSCRQPPASSGSWTPPRWRFSRRERSAARSEEHTSELQSRQYLVCRLLLEKKKKIIH